jgi:hypothetical protein
MNAENTESGRTMCYLDCYMDGDPDGFPTATYAMPSSGYHWKHASRSALKHFDRIELVRETNGQSIQTLPDAWRFGRRT